MLVAEENLYHLGLDQVQIPVRVSIRAQFVADFAAADACLMRQLLEDIGQRLQAIATRSTLPSVAGSDLPVLVKAPAVFWTYQLEPTSSSYQLSGEQGRRPLKLCRETIVVQAIPSGQPISLLPRSDHNKLITDFIP